MSDYTGSWHVDRRYTNFRNDEFILDVVSKGEGFYVIAEKLKTGEKETGSHKTSETIAINKALDKF
ncbi:hypothetical protein ACJ2A9_04915 [Anaerobacillus sp. MEB173]|uniref:hypothetical protein n=1 Tax=Anaerobacillus sp. MEB173 TaxID=3383345 RepID=UPI003F8FBB6A